MRCKLVINNKFIEQIMQFRYLDIKDLSNQINKSAIISECLRETVRTNPCIRKKKRILRVVEMSVLRRIVGKTRRDHVRNTDIPYLQDVVSWERQRRRE